EEQLYRSPRLGFSVGYSGSWGNGRALPGGGVSIDTADGGFLEIVGSRTESPAQMIVDRLGRFSQQVFPDVRALGPVHGARIGTVNGVGTLYGATLVPTGGGPSQRVRFALIAAQRGSLTLLVTAADYYDQSITGYIPTGMPQALAMDYALTAFAWPS